MINKGSSCDKRFCPVSEPQSEDDEVSTITGLCEELEIMKNMDHPNIIRLLGKSNLQLFCSEIAMC